MTFHSPITASSPIALSAAFGQPMLNLEPDSAVVTIRKALDRLPAGVRDGSLEELSCTFETARALGATLSKAIRPLFVAWLDAAIRFERTPADDDDLLNARCDMVIAACEPLLAEPSLTSADMHLKNYILLTAVIDTERVGGRLLPLKGQLPDSYLIDHAAKAMRADLLAASPLARALAYGDALEAENDAAMEWDRLMLEWQAARGEYARISALHNEAEIRYFDLQPERPAQPDAPHSVGLENIENMTIAEIKATKPETHPAWIEYEASKSAWEEACSEARVASGLAEAEEIWDKAVSNCGEIARQLLAFPAPDHSYIARKLEVVKTEFGTPDESDFEAIMADIVRLSGGQQVH